MNESPLILRISVAFLLVLSTHLSCGVARADEGPKLAKGGKGRAKAVGELLNPVARLDTAGLQEDFASMCFDARGTAWVVYVEYSRLADVLKLAEQTPRGLVSRGTLSASGDVFQPCLACDGAGTLWCIWSQLDDGQWKLLARAIESGKPSAETVTLADTLGNHVFADAKTDRRGRVWVAWQAFADGLGDVFVKRYDPAAAAWSESIRVTSRAAGDWEPRLALGSGDEALVVFDTYREGNFDVLLARVSPSGQVRLLPVATSPRYEARAEAAASPDGSTLWVAYEDGVVRWGKDLGSEWRRLGGGLHFDRHLYLARVDLATGKAERVADVAPLVPGLPATLGQPTSASICLPELIVDDRGRPWLFYRYGSANWQVAVTNYDPKAGRWSLPRTIAGSNYCQDRRTSAALAPDGSIVAVCSADGRGGKDQGDSGVLLAKIDTRKVTPSVEASVFAVQQKRVAPPFEPVNQTPERGRDERFVLERGAKKYTLCWGDLHRHTEFSNCRTTDDGCVTEQFRYALDAAGLDFLATTDHSDQGAGYSEYEWWQNQKLADLFYRPGNFVSLYGYEREQGAPYGHRNVFFIERDGPIVYIKRQRFAASRWGRLLGVPEQAGKRQGEIDPPQLWQLLEKSGMNALSIAHTPGGNDWSLFDQIDARVEPVLEIYQGSRQSYEGAGAPQPPVAKQSAAGSLKKKPARSGGGRGTFQDALAQGHKLGAIASSDHRSTNISFAGVYVESIDRAGVFEGIHARRTIAATDKILMKLSCGDRILGEVFTTDEKPTLNLAVDGTAPLRSVTVIRNETIIYSHQPKDTAGYEGTFCDMDPDHGENRYYLRVEQVDGNMGWTSPLWVTYAPK